MDPKAIFGVLMSLSNCRVPGLNGFSFQTVLTQLQVLRKTALPMVLLQLLRGASWPLPRWWLPSLGPPHTPAAEVSRQHVWGQCWAITRTGAILWVTLGVTLGAGLTTKLDAFSSQHDNSRVNCILAKGEGHAVSSSRWWLNPVRRVTVWLGLL